MKRIFSIVALILALVLALASCADAPTVEISEDGYWIINGEKTDVLAKGEKGDQGIQGEKGDAAANENPQGLYFFLKDDGTYVVEIGLAKYLSKIEIPAKYNGRAVTEIGNSGFQSDRLVEIAIPDSVTSIGNSAFGNCKNLTSVTIPDSVTSIGERAFYYCESLESLTIPDSVTEIGDSAFCCCSSLKSVTIPDSVTEIGNNAFQYCYKLVEIINKSSLTITVGSWDYGYVAYYALEVHSGESKIVNKDGYLFYTYGGVNYLVGYTGDETDLILPESYNGENYEINKYALYRCTNITSITIPDSVTSIGNYAFSGCTSLTSVTIGNGVTEIGDYAFSSCTSLTSVTIGNGVTSIGEGAFFDCRNLTSIKYRGTEAEWNTISKGYRWDYNAGNYTITYNYDGE